MIEKESVFDANDQKLKPVKLTLREANKDPVLVKEMYNQLNDAFLRTGSVIEYVARLKDRNHQYSIIGTYKEWKIFFGMDDVVETNKVRKLI